MRDEGHIAPAAAPTVFVPPCARSYPPTLDRTTRIVRIAPRLFVPPRTRSYHPAPIRTAPCRPALIRTHVFHSAPAFVALRSCLLLRACLHCIFIICQTKYS